MTAYRKDHVKRNPDTGTYAIRTMFDDEDPQQADHAWYLVGGTQIGTNRCRTDMVDNWDDLFVPPEPTA